MRTVAEQYHDHCVKLLINLRGENQPRGADLAAVCLLRSYEILAEEVDPNRHLSGAYALVVDQPLGFQPPKLLVTGVFNYLREDITFSLMNRCSLKMSQDLDTLRSKLEFIEGHGQLNSITLLLGRAINGMFCDNVDDDMRRQLESEIGTWEAHNRGILQPYSATDFQSTSGTFPSIWMLGDCYTAIAQYHLVCQSVLASSASASIEVLEVLETNAAQLCGLAFTNGCAAVIVNSFGPMSFCGRHRRSSALRSELVRRLIACEKETGWPVRRIINDLEQHWSASV